MGLSFSPNVETSVIVAASWRLVTVRRSTHLRAADPSPDDLHAGARRQGRSASRCDDLRPPLTPTTTEQARLIAVQRTTDGFELAEKDWELRREGNVLGLVQSGFPQLRVASLQEASHRDLASRARTHAEALLDPAGRIRRGAEAFDNELRQGWLARVFAGDPGGSA